MKKLASYKQFFFDRKAVMSAVDRGARQVLSKFGAFVRRTAKSSIRRRKAVSNPGQPPSSHTGLLKKLIYFGYDPDHKNVVIGPEPLNGRSDGAHSLEYGGRQRIRTSGRKRVNAIYRARPFMGPAFDKEKPKLPAMWAGSVKP